MSRAAFLEEFAEVFDVSSDKMTEAFVFESPEVWESLAIVSTIGLVDEHFGVILKAADLMACASVADLFKTIDAKAER